MKFSKIDICLSSGGQSVPKTELHITICLQRASDLWKVKTGILTIVRGRKPGGGHG